MNTLWKVDFIGIGPMKAGTTWVGHLLERHPQICMAEPKEVHFFNDSLSFNQSYSTRHFSLGFDWYASHFKHCKSAKIKGEITPRYIIDPVVPKRIHDHNPEIKLIVCLRNPFERIVSHYHSARDYHKSESRSLSQAIREEPEYIEAGKYYKYISHYLHYFRLDQFFFVDMDNVQQDATNMVRALYAFLGATPDFVPESLFEKSNPARSTRSVKVRKWSSSLHRTLVGMGLSPIIRKLKRTGVGKLINKLNSAPIEKVDLTTEDKQYIIDQLSDDIQKFSTLINKDLSSWLKL